MSRIMRIAIITGLAIVLCVGCVFTPEAVNPTETVIPKTIDTPKVQEQIPEVPQEMLTLTAPETIPEDVLPQVGSYFYGESIADIMEADCSHNAKGATWCKPYGGATLDVPLLYENAVCGVTQDTTPIVKLRTPTNELDESISARISVYLDCWLISYQPRPGSALGTYQVTFEQNDILLADTFTLALPGQPQAAWKDDCAWFAGYQPGQSLRLITAGALFYGQAIPPMDPSVTVWQFVAERKLNVDANGMLQFCKSDFIKDQYADILVIARPEGGSPLILGDQKVGEVFLNHTCAGSAPTRLKVDGNAQVKVDELGVTEMPVSYNQDAIDTLHSGDSVRVIDGPVCTEFGIFLWKVRTPSGAEGWVIEVNGSDYNLEPE